MRRRKLDPADAAELDALERILAEEPVEAIHLELAALVESVRADAPQLDDDATARLDERLAAGARSPRRASWQRRRHNHAGDQPIGALRRRPRGRVVAAGAVGLAAVAAIVVTGVSLTAGGRSQTLEPESAVITPASPPAARAGATAGPAVVTPSAAPAGAPAGLPAGPSGAPRLQQRAATLTLATGVSSFAQVADEIVAGTEQLNGVVQTSSVTEAGNASLATFSLTVPSGSLSQLIATLSRLARVQSLDQSTEDITDAYHQATSRLGASRGERDALFVALGRATAPNETASLHDRIDALNGLIAAELRAVDSLGAQARTATLAVTLQPAPAATAHVGGTLHTGLHDALDVLQVSLAVALVALAVLAPLAIVAGLGWWLWWALRRRGRERALQTS